MPDPTPTPAFEPNDDFVAGVRAGVTRHRRRTRRRATAGLAAVAVLAGAGLWTANDRLSSIDRIDINGTVPEQDPLDSEAPFNLLLAGLDTCEGPEAPADDPLQCDLRQDEGLSDVMMLVHVDPQARTLDLLSLYRDLGLPDGRKLSQVGIEALPAQIDALIGVQVDHVATIDMVGFRDLAGRLGLRIALDAPVRDRSTGLDLQAGCQQLSGQQALALLRSRHFQYDTPDGWSNDPTGDLGRVTRQQAVLRIALDQWRSFDLSSAAALDDLLDDIAVDDGMSSTDLLRLARLLQTSTLRSASVLPTRSGGNEGVSMQYLAEPEVANRTLAPFGGHIAGTDTGPGSTFPNPPFGPGTIGWDGISAC